MAATEAYPAAWDRAHLSCFWAATVVIVVEEAIINGELQASSRKAQVSTPAPGAAGMRFWPCDSVHTAQWPSAAQWPSTQATAQQAYSLHAPVSKAQMPEVG